MKKKTTKSARDVGADGPRPAKSASRLCVKRVTNRRTSLERPIGRRRLPFTTPAQLVRDVTATLVPAWNPIGASFTSFCDEHRRLEISYGEDERGTKTVVEVHLEEADILPFMRYLLTVSSRVTSCILHVNLPPAADDDGGLELPKVSEAALEAMATTGTYQ